MKMSGKESSTEEGKMDRADASKEILRFWKTQWDAYIKSMLALQSQGEMMLDSIQQSGVLQEGSKKMVKEWADKFKVIQNAYLDMVEDHFKKMVE